MSKKINHFAVDLLHCKGVNKDTINFLNEFMDVHFKHTRYLQLFKLRYEAQATFKVMGEAQNVGMARARQLLRTGLRKAWRALLADCGPTHGEEWETIKYIPTCGCASCSSIRSKEMLK